MQVISKFEQPSSPPSSSMNLMENITKLLEKGQESAQQIRKLFNEGLRLKVEDDHQADLDHHSKVTLNSIETALSLFKTYAFDQKDKIIKKRKIENPESPHSSKSDQTGGTIVPKERRGCYKRRKGDESWTMEATSLIDDGHAWRKYGQKEILNTNYPRNYYRCTHKHDQKCQAIKQVQQISENPTKYNIIYHGKHTCQNPNKTPSFIIENPEEKSIIFNFQTNNITKSKHTLNPSNLFPTSTFNPDRTPVKMIKQEYTLIKEESSPPLISIDLDHLSDQTAQNNLQYSSCSDNHVPSSSDLTSVGLCSTPVSDQGDAISAFDFGTDDEILSLITLDDHHYYNDRLDGMFEN